MNQFKILDGALGSELINRGINLPKHIWSAYANTNYPDIVREIHTDYIQAGADFITANTFRTTPRAYYKYITENNINLNPKILAKKSLKLAMKIAKEIAGKKDVIGSVAPLEDCYQPNHFPGYNIAKQEFSQIIKQQIEFGADIILLETMNSIIETKSALDAIKNKAIPIWVSLVLKDSKHLMSGDLIIEMCDLINNSNINMALLNCNSIERTKNALNIFVNNINCDWGIYPNLGEGNPSPDGIIAKISNMNIFSDLVNYSIELGASVIGGCCGSNFNHIATINKIRNTITTC
tara:strand:+ start:461 stop:1339 length:879 start_codon:yes stop_codon:yes gene_type:complete